MYIRFVIFLLSIFMVFVPCYGMQVANILLQDSKTANLQIVSSYKIKKVKKIKKKKWYSIAIGVLLIIAGFAGIVFVGMYLTAALIAWLLLGWLFSIYVPWLLLALLAFTSFISLFGGIMLTFDFKKLFNK
jgi:pheromone shutdown protein TraB